MRSKSSMYNLVAAMLLQIITLLSGIILPKIMLMAFGSEINGLVSSIKQFISYLTLVEAGLAGACVYSLYKPLVDKNEDEINSILSGAKKFYNRSGIIFSVLALVLSIIFPYIAKSNTISSLTITVLVLILGINGSLEFFSMGKYRALLTADQKSYVISIVQAIGQILNCIIIIVMALNKYSIVFVQLVATTSYIVRSMLFHIYVSRNYKFVNFNVAPNKRALKQRWDVLFHQIGSMVVFNSPIALITVFCTLVEVSIYTIYNMVFVGIYGIVSIFNNGLMAAIGDIISRGDTKGLQRVYREYECGYYMIVTWMYTSTYLLILPFMSVYTKGVTDANYMNSTLATGFVIIGVLNTLRMPQVTVVNAAGHFKQTRYRALTEIIINVVASVLFVNYFGMIGVILGGICSYSYRTLDFIFYAPKYITHIPVKETLKRVIRMVLLGAIVILPFKVGIQIAVNNFIQWIIWGVIIAMWSGVVIFIGNYSLEKATVKSLIKRMVMVVKSIKTRN